MWEILLFRPCLQDLSTWYFCSKPQTVSEQMSLYVSKYPYLLFISLLQAYVKRVYRMYCERGCLKASSGRSECAHACPLYANCGSQVAIRVPDCPSLFCMSAVVYTYISYLRGDIWNGEVKIYDPMIFLFFNLIMVISIFVDLVMIIW